MRGRTQGCNLEIKSGDVLFNNFCIAMLFICFSAVSCAGSSILLSEIAVNMLSFVLSVLASISASLLVGYNLGKKNSKTYLLPRETPKGTRKNTILVAGLGASGKTSLIQMLTKTFNVDRPRRTENFEIYTCVRAETGESPILLVLSDYRGQDFSQLISGFVEEQFDPKTWLKYGDINSLVLVVDLFPYNTREDEDPDERLDHLDESRIREHMDEWNHTALDAVFGLLKRPALKYVCLFINKIDKWKNGNYPDAEEEVKKRYYPLIDDLRQRLDESPIVFNVIIGSALRSDGVMSIATGLMQKFFQHAQPVRKGEAANG